MDKKEKEYPSTCFVEKVFIIKDKMVRDGVVKPDNSSQDAFLRGLVWSGAIREHNYAMISERVTSVWSETNWEQSLDDVGFFKLGRETY